MPGQERPNFPHGNIARGAILLYPKRRRSTGRLSHGHAGRLHPKPRMGRPIARYGPTRHEQPAGPFGDESAEGNRRDHAVGQKAMMDAVIGMEIYEVKGVGYGVGE